MNKTYLGQVFTPKKIVSDMLNLVGYSINNELSSLKIIDNSCGDGAFLQEIVIRLIKKYNTNAKRIIENNVFGIEFDKVAYEKCIENLNKICKENGISDVKWNIKNTNTLKVYNNYKNKFDIVVGNPPYVRIHNIKEDLTNFNFCNKGMSDLYIAFYEIGLLMLNKNGKLCYINPSSVFTSKASCHLRKHIIQNKLLSRVIDFKHTQLFEKITTYSCVILLDENNKLEQLYFSNTFKNFVCLNYDEIYLNSNFYFSTNKNELLMLKEILLNPNKSNIEVKNGIATLSDNVFIKDKFEFDSDHLVDIIKASTNKKQKCIFPYDLKTTESIDLKELPNNIKKYMIKNELVLKQRSSDNKEKWWLFGRSQSIKDFNKEKITINTTIKNVGSVKMSYLKSGTLVYSGLYILNGNKDIVNMIKSKNFINYVSILAKYKSGGYYTFNSKDLKTFIDYYLTIL